MKNIKFCIFVTKPSNFPEGRKKFAKFKLSTKIDLFLLLNIIEDTIIQSQNFLFFALLFLCINLSQINENCICRKCFVQFHYYKENSICYSFKFSNAVNVSAVSKRQSCLFLGYFYLKIYFFNMFLLHFQAVCVTKV